MALTGSEEALVRELIAQNAALLSLADNEATITSKLGATIVELSDLSPTASVSGTDLMLIRQGTTDKSITPAVLLAPTIEDLTLPTGIILMWSGAVFAIPSGYALCDGTGGTPDLRNRFIVGAGDDYAVNATGGAESHSHSVTVNGHVLTAAQMPVHNHTVIDPGHAHQQRRDDNFGAQNTSGGNPDATYGALEYGLTSPATTGITLSSAGGDQSHNHTASSGTVDNRPPYYALAFIMKL